MRVLRGIWDRFYAKHLSGRPKIDIREIHRLLSDGRFGTIYEFSGVRKYHWSNGEGEFTIHYMRCETTAWVTVEQMRCGRYKLTLLNGEKEKIVYSDEVVETITRRIRERHRKRDYE